MVGIIESSGLDLKFKRREIRGCECHLKFGHFGIQVIGLDCTGAVEASAKAGIGIDDILAQICELCPPPEVCFPGYPLGFFRPDFLMDVDSLVQILIGFWLRIVWDIFGGMSRVS